MTPEINTTYIGPDDQHYTVLAIDGDPGGLQWVLIRALGAVGTIRFPLWDAAKWLSPMRNPSRTSAALGDSAMPILKKP